jgi:hypothetical protein
MPAKQSRVMEVSNMAIQLTTSASSSAAAPFKTKAQYLQSNPAITKGGLDWVIFHKRAELLEERTIAYFGRKVLIHEENLNRYILEGGTQVIGGAA